MGQALGGTAGTAVGSAFGGPLGGAVGGLAGSLIGGYLSGGGKDQVREGPRLANLRVATSKYGEEILSVAGRMRPAGKVIWGPPIREVVNESKESGGKGGGPEITTRTFVYFASWANLICTGEMGDLLRVWFDARLMYDVRESASPATRANSLAFAQQYMTYYPGSESQGPDPTIVAAEGVGSVPANKGMAYAVFKDFPLTDFGNRRPSVSFEVASRTAVSTFLVVSESDNGKVYKVQDMSLVQDLQGTMTQTQCSRFNHAATVLAMGNSGTKYVDLFDTSDWSLMPALSPVPGSAVDTLQFSNDDSLLIVSETSTPYWGIYRTSDWTRLPDPVATLDARVTGIAFNPDDTLVAIGTRDNYEPATMLEVYNTTTWARLGALGPQLPSDFYRVRSVAWSHDGKWLAVGMEFNRPILVYDTATWTLLPDPPGPVLDEGVNEIRFSPDDQYLAVGQPQTPYFYLLKTAPNTSNWSRLPDVPDPKPATGNGVAFDAGTTQVAVANGGPPGRIYRYSLPDQTPLPNPVNIPDNRANSCDYDIGFVTAEQLPRADIIDRICEESGLAPDMFDTSAIEGMETGFFWGVQSGRSKLENLAIAGFFNGVESQGAVRFRPRGVHSGVTIGVEEMVTSVDGSDPGPALTITPGDEIEVPQLLSISYPQSAKAYEQGEAHQKRQVTASIRNEQIDVRVVMDAGRAARVADTALYQMWAERKLFSFALTMKYYALDPGDVITIEDPESGNAWDVRLVSIVMDGYTFLECKGVEENLGLYDSNADGAGGPAEADEVATLGDTTAVLLDVPMLIDSQNDPRIYYALAGESAGWVGGVLQRSRDGGASYETVSQTPISGTLGETDTLLADGITHTWDLENTVDVTLDNADKTLESVAELAVLNGANAAALGSSGRWEIIQYANAELIGPSQYRLSKLLRGQLGTEHNTGNHTATDRFVLLTANLVTSAPTSLAELNRARLFKGVSVGQDPGVVTGFPFTYTGVNLKPYSPVQAKGTRDGSNNLTVTFFRRSRFAAPMLKTPILGETIERYQFDILDPDVVNTYETTSTTFTYTAAQQTADGLTPGDPVTLRIFQMSEAVGRGYPLEVTL